MLFMYRGKHNNKANIAFNTANIKYPFTGFTIKNNKDKEPIIYPMDWIVSKIPIH